MQTELAERGGGAIARTEPTPMELIQAAISSGMSADTIERLVALKNSEEDRAARKSFIRAVASFQDSCPPILKTKLVDYGTGNKNVKYAHAELDKIAPLLRGELRKYQLSFRWVSKPSEKAPGITEETCILSHDDGHTESATLAGPSDTSGGKNALQGIGSASSYLQRYTLLKVLGLVARGTDNDGKLPEPEKDKPITKEQAEELARGLNETKSDWERFYTHFQVGELDQLKEGQLVEARRMIAAKRRAK